MPPCARGNPRVRRRTGAHARKRGCRADERCLYNAKRERERVCALPLMRQIGWRSGGPTAATLPEDHAEQPKTDQRQIRRRSERDGALRHCRLNHEPAHNDRGYNFHNKAQCRKTPDCEHGSATTVPFPYLSCKTVKNLLTPPGFHRATCQESRRFCGARGRQSARVPWRKKSAEARRSSAPCPASGRRL